MASVIETLKAQVAALEEIDARNRGGVDDLLSMADPELLSIPTVAQAIARTASGVVAAAAGEIARRSAINDESSLARRSGERSAVGLVAKRAGISTREAVQLVKVGEATRPNSALSGEPLQAKHPHLADALAAGRLSVALAELIQGTLAKVAHVLWVDQADELEATLVGMAAGGEWSVAEFTRYCKQVPDRLDPDGAEPREDALRALARITETRLPNGLLRVTADLHPELEGWWKTAMAAKTAPRRRNGLGLADDSDGAGDGDGGSDSDADSTVVRSGLLAPDDRTQPDVNQIKLEALTTILRQSIQADDGQAAGIDVEPVKFSV